MKLWLQGLIVSLAAVLAPIKAMMITSGALIFVDLITGVWAALKTGDKISSAKLRNTISKAVIYQLAIISGFICEKYLLDGALPVSKLIAGVIGMVELTSVLENANKIFGQNLFAVIVQQLGSSNLVGAKEAVKTVETPKKD
jgi:hypothetical protein